MSRHYETRVTVTIDGNEQDVAARALVRVGWDTGHPNGFGAELDGDIDVFTGGDWFPIDSVNLDAADRARIEESLCEAALDDDSDACIDLDIDGRRCA